MNLKKIFNKTQSLNAFRRKIPRDEVLSIEHNWPSALPSDTLRTLWIGLKNKSQETINLNSSDNRQIYITIRLNKELLTKLEISKNTLSPR